MSYTSTSSAFTTVSPSGSAPIAIKRTTRAGSTTSSSNNDSLQDFYLPFAATRRGSSASNISDYSSAVRKQGCGVEKRPSAYVSDADLLGVDVDDDVPYLSEPPAPPRPAEVWLAQPLLPRVYGRPVRRASPAMRKPRVESHSPSKK